MSDGPKIRRWPIEGEADFELALRSTVRMHNPAFLDHLRRRIHELEGLPRPDINRELEKAAMHIDGERSPFLLDDPAIAYRDVRDKLGFMPYACATALIHTSCESG
jgi:hypothetical protein